MSEQSKILSQMARVIEREQERTGAGAPALARAYPKPSAAQLPAQSLTRVEVHGVAISPPAESIASSALAGNGGEGKPAPMESKRDYNRRKQAEFRERTAIMMRDRAYLRRAAHTLMLNIVRGEIAPPELQEACEGADPVAMLELLARYFAGRLPWQTKHD